MSKRAAIQAMLEKGVVVVQCDGRSCDVPANLRTEWKLVLRVGHELEPPMFVELDDDYLHMTCAFGAERYRCRLPWTAINIAQLDGEAWSLVMWPNSFPREGVEPLPPPAPVEEAAPARRGFLRSVD